METFKAFLVREHADGTFTRKIETRNTDDLPGNDVLIRVKYSSLNYKDALSSSGHKGVTRCYPHTPGIDASGLVVEDRTGHPMPGDDVIVTGYDLGMNTSGGFGQYIRVPGDWIVPLPGGLTLEESMIFGTAGFTAGVGMHKMIVNGQHPGQGRVVVTGASGGVGSMAVALFTRAGFEVIAATGKDKARPYLEKLGAVEIIPRSETNDNSGKPLLRPRWAGAFDNVGGNTLATLIKACGRHGNIVVVGNVSSTALDTTVFPFILNGVNVLGVDSATTPKELRTTVWKNLSGDWRPSTLKDMAHIITLDELDPFIDQILKGEVTGRIVIKH